MNTTMNISLFDTLLHFHLYALLMFHEYFFSCDEHENTQDRFNIIVIGLQSVTQNQIVYNA